MYTQHQIITIRQNVTALHQKCMQSGACHISQKDVEIAHDRIVAATDALKSTKWDRFLLPVYLRYILVAKKLDILADYTGFPWYLICLIVGAAWFTIGLLLTFMLVGAWISLLIAALMYVMGFIATFILMTYPREKELTQVENQVRPKIEKMKALKLEIIKQKDIAESIIQLYRLRQKYELAVNKSQQCDLWLQDKRNQLLLREWRSLRGIYFEEYLAAAFEANGFVVHTTKASGDQGVDLIVIRQTLKLAIQAKGYEGSVGNAAVQQALAGMQYYGCNCCAVITNSYFTPNAIDLASKTGCRLIDGAKIHDLIRDAHSVITTR